MWVLTVAIALYSTSWVLLTQTSASLLLPNSEAAKDRLHFALSIFTASSWRELWLKLRILSIIAKQYLVVLPSAAYLWTIDEILFGRYRDVVIRMPMITISVPRAGTTSFHRTLALDERFVTPNMLELVMPFLCVHKVIYAVHNASPALIHRLETFLKWINGVTPEVEARHPISLFSPDADDILLGEWHWVSVGACRTFPVANQWRKHYQMDKQPKHQRERSLLLHKRLCQKIMYNRGKNDESWLLLRSHLSCCVEDFQLMYPDALVVGILRDPVDVLRSFAGLSAMAISSATGFNILEGTYRSKKLLIAGKENDHGNSKTNFILPWPSAFVDILSDMMGREAGLYGSTNEENWKGRCHYVTFYDFKSDPLKSIRALYGKVKLPMTAQFTKAIQRGLGHHETYNKRHVYQNPKLEDMEIDEDQFRDIREVKQYSRLVQR